MPRFAAGGFLRWSSLFCLPVLLALSGCGSDGTGHAEDYFDHICAHMQTTENWWGHVEASGDMENPTMTGAEDWLHKRVEVELDGGVGMLFSPSKTRRITWSASARTLGSCSTSTTRTMGIRC